MQYNLLYKKVTKYFQSLNMLQIPWVSMTSSRIIAGRQPASFYACADYASFSLLFIG